MALTGRVTGVRWTYREFAAEGDAVALGLLAMGDRVDIWALNRAEGVLTRYATAKIGAVLVTINPAYRAHELEYVLNQAGIRMLIAARQFKTSEYAKMIEQVRPRWSPRRRCSHRTTRSTSSTPQWDSPKWPHHLRRPRHPGTVAAERCTSAYGVPTLFIAELTEPELDTYDLPSLHAGSRPDQASARRPARHRL